MKAALDSNVLIYAFDDHKDLERRELRRRARLLLQTLEDQEALILVPTVALAEYLVIYPPEHHGQITAELNRTFLFPPCDVRAASIAAEIWDKHRSFKKVDKVERGVFER